MSKVFVVTNQHGLFVNKHKEWVDGQEPKVLFRSPYKDEALNLVFEVSSKDIYLRAEAISVELDDKKQPVIEVIAEAVVEKEPLADEVCNEAIDNSDEDEAQPEPLTE